MHSLHANGVRLAYYHYAPVGPDKHEPIVLVHGFASNHRINWVAPRWVDALTKAGRRVVALDNRGHGESQKFYDPEAYDTTKMAADVVALIDHLELGRVDLMGYSMGARIVAQAALARADLARSIILGGLGLNLIEGAALPLGIAEAMEAASLDELTDPMQRMFRAFADNSGADKRALAACIRGARQTLSERQVRSIQAPALIAVGTQDPVSGDGPALARLFPHGESLAIPGRDHNRAVGDKVYKEGVLDFLDRRA